MPAAIWEVTQDDRDKARGGIDLQNNSLPFPDFLENQVELVASLNAEIRFLRNIIHPKRMEEA